MVIKGQERCFQTPLSCVNFQKRMRKNGPVSFSPHPKHPHCLRTFPCGDNFEGEGGGGRSVRSLRESEASCSARAWFCRKPPVLKACPRGGEYRTLCVRNFLASWLFRRQRAASPGRKGLCLMTRNPGGIFPVTQPMQLQFLSGSLSRWSREETLQSRKT